MIDKKYIFFIKIRGLIIILLMIIKYFWNMVLQKYYLESMSRGISYMKWENGGLN